MSKGSLKTKNLKFILIVLTIDITICLTMQLDKEISSVLIFSSWLSLLKNGTFIAIAPIAGLLINRLIPPSIKAAVVFWRAGNSLPGCRAFSKLAHHDPRIDINALKKKLGAFPTTAKEQNALWYRLFKQHESNIAIEEAHQQFLFFRDITSMTVLMFTVLLIIAYLGISNINDLTHALVLITAQYLMFLVAARNTANRLVQNVLALEGISTKFSKGTKK